MHSGKYFAENAAERFAESILETAVESVAEVLCEALQSECKKTISISLILAKSIYRG